VFETTALTNHIERLQKQVQELSETCERAETRAKKAEDRARAMEERGDSAVEQVRRDMTTRIGDVQKKQYEDAATIQLLRADQAQSSQLTTRLLDDIHKQDSKNMALEASQRAIAGTAERALRVAEETAQEQANLAESVRERLLELTTQAPKGKLEAVKKQSTSQRIMQLQSQRNLSGGQAAAPAATPQTKFAPLGP